MSSIPSQQQTAVTSTRADAAPPTSGTSGMSRRRLTFRPYSVAQPQYGKDFEQVAKLMTRRKMNKDKEQIRNYYFNSFKLLRSNALIDEELLADVPRDARELFVVINGFEWRKRTGDAKFDPAKLRQLILEGSTSVRPRKKKQAVPIRTPACPALQKLFPSQKAEEPLPSHIFVYLSPRYEADRSYVESCGQNPLIRIRLAMTEHLSSIFKLLKIKWTHRLRKIDEELNIDDKDALNLTIFPDKTTRLGRLFVRYVEDSGPNAFCINRLRKERSQRCAEECDEHSNHSDTGTVPRPMSFSESCHPEAFQVEVPSSSYNESSSFVLNEVTLRSGLTETTVGDATATELFYLCGMEQKIYLQYSTNRPRNRAIEPWNIFVSLITRNYGENLCKILAEPESADEARQVMVTVEDRTRKRRISNCNESGAVGAAQQKPNITSSSKPSILSTADTPSSSAGGSSCANVCDQVVESENNAFMLQLESLQTKKRSKPYTQRAQLKRIAAHAPMSNPNGAYENAATVASSTPAYATNVVQQSAVGATCQLLRVQASSSETEQQQHPTDFSSIIASSPGVANVVSDRPLAETPELDMYHPIIATPNTRFAAEVLTSLTEQRQQLSTNTTLAHQQYIDVPSSHCEHETYPKHPGHPSEVRIHYITERASSNLVRTDIMAQHFENNVVYKQQQPQHQQAVSTVIALDSNTMEQQNEKTLTELSAVDLGGAVGGSSLDLSPMKGSSNLPDDVRYSFEMMMQQNSVDYCRNFEQLLTSMDTPKKIP
ncbi:Protein cramped-like [Toxocara canis]|uniref:Protein cramped-like n=1 Tax=Toxocara canis TaxID=6265 RepID=A0A0B2VAI2_TOXCA|nr:Protein cramped-like [Toxocara canis]